MLNLILYSISRKSQKVNIFFTKHKQRRFLIKNDKKIDKKRAAEAARVDDKHISVSIFANFR